MKKKSNKTRSKTVSKATLQKKFDHLNVIYIQAEERAAELKREYDQEYAARIKAEAECHRLTKVTESSRVIIGNMLSKMGGCFSYRPQGFSSLPLVRVKQDQVIGVTTVYIGSPDTKETTDERTIEGLEY